MEPELADVTVITLTLGCLFLCGLVADITARRYGVPRITLLLLIGLAVGPNGANLIPEIDAQAMQALSTATLAFVSFLLGESFHHDKLRQQGHRILILSVVIALGTALAVIAILSALGLPIILCLLLGAVATATDPIATRDVISQSHSREEFPCSLNGIVALDDAWGIILFSIILGIAESLSHSGSSVSAWGSLLTGSWELLGGGLLGVALGFPMAYLTGRLAQGEPTLAEALGFVFLCAGLSTYLGVSMLFAAMVMGAVTVNFARHHRRPFRAIAGIEWPLLIVFLFLTAASVDLTFDPAIAYMVTVYCLARVAGRFLSGWVAAAAVGASPTARLWYGPALLPQAGVAVGMALVGAQHFPATAHLLMPVVIIATVLFEIIGPVLTMTAIARVTSNNGKNHK